jgi:hypothetical protein
MQEGYGPATYYGMFVSVMEAQGYIPDPFDDDAYDRLIEYHREIAGS